MRKITRKNRKVGNNDGYVMGPQEIMSAETVEEAKALYERCPRLLKEKVKAILSRAALRKSHSKEAQSNAKNNS